jgi:preprotein translocase subunit SecG
MVILLTILHVIVCVFLVIVVLLQSGKAADLAGAFGGMGSQTVFGPRGSATVLSKATTVAAALFMLTSLSLSILATRTGSGTPTLLDKAKAPPATQQKGAPAPAAPAQPTPAAPAAPAQVQPGGPAQTIPNSGGVNVQAVPLAPGQKAPEQKK